MKIIKYNLIEEVNIGTEEEPIIEKRKGLPVEIPCRPENLEANLAIAQKEAFEEPEVTDDGQPEVYQPTESERLEALEQAMLEMMGVSL